MRIHLTVPLLLLTSLTTGRLWGQAPVTQAHVDGDAQTDLMVTVYNNGYGLVREVRRFVIPQGTVELEFRDVAEQIDPTSVAFKSLTAPQDVGILEQNYRYDLLSPETLLSKYVGRTVRVETLLLQNNSHRREVREGTLLSTNAGIIVRFGEQIVINPAGSITLAEVPPDLLARPTLLWLLRNDRAGEQEVETSYLTNGLNWKADYVAVINAEDTQLDLTGWVTLINQSGATYRNAQLKLVAGDVQRVQDEIRRLRVMPEALAAAREAPQFEERAFFEYHLYTLNRRATVAQRETKQMTLLEGTGVPARKRFMLESPPWALQAGIKGVESRKLSVMLEFENKKDHGLGIPLPQGRIRAYKADTDGSLQLIGEDTIDHTPRDERLRLKLGEAFDVLAERSQTDFRRLAERVTELSYEVRLRNHKETAIEATILEHVYGDWTVIRQSHPHQKRDAQTIEFTVPVAAGDETVVTYTVRVAW